MKQKDNKYMKHFLFIALFCFSLMGVKAQGFQLDLNGVVTFNENKLVVREAGEDIDAKIISKSHVYLSIGSYYFWEMINARWKILVHKSNIEWDDDIKLEVRRRGKGYNGYYNGSPKVYGGASFFEVTNTPTEFFSGKSLVYDIPLKFRVRNLSLAMGANDFETDVIFTIYDD